MRSPRELAMLLWRFEWEKLKDTGYPGLPEKSKGTFDDLWLPNSTAPGAFAQLATAYSENIRRSQTI